MCQYQVWVQPPDTSKNMHMCLSVHLFEKLGQRGKSYYRKKKIQWGALQLKWTTVILSTATDLCWLTPAEVLISYASENWCNFFHSCSRISILSWGINSNLQLSKCRVCSESEVQSHRRMLGHMSSDFYWPIEIPLKYGFGIHVFSALV